MRYLRNGSFVLFIGAGLLGWQAHVAADLSVCCPPGCYCTYHHVWDFGPPISISAECAGPGDENFCQEQEYNISDYCTYSLPYDLADWTETGVPCWETWLDHFDGCVSESNNDFSATCGYWYICE